MNDQCHYYGSNEKTHGIFNIKNWELIEYRRNKTMSRSNSIAMNNILKKQIHSFHVYSLKRTLFLSDLLLSYSYNLINEKKEKEKSQFHLTNKTNWLYHFSRKKLSLNSSKNCRFDWTKDIRVSHILCWNVQTNEIRMRFIVFSFFTKAS